MVYDAVGRNIGIFRPFGIITKPPRRLRFKVKLPPMFKPEIQRANQLATKRGRVSRNICGRQATDLNEARSNESSCRTVVNGTILFIINLQPRC